MGMIGANSLSVQLKNRFRQLAWSNQVALSLATTAVDAGYLARKKLRRGRQANGTKGASKHADPADLGRLRRYQSQFEQITGSFWAGAVITWDILLSRQAALGIKGDVLEIGVLNGKSATLIALHACTDESFVLVDPALRREAIDAVESLHPSNNIYIRDFSQNLRKHVALAGRESGFRWIHIDGEHSGPAVRNDLAIGADLLAPGGVICLDDFFTPAYPQITAAVFEFLGGNYGKFQLFLIGYNKGYICHCSDAAGNLAFLRQKVQREYARRDFAVTLWKTAEPSDMNCFGVTPRVQSAIYKGPDWAPETIPI
jgi:Methyltransferase domain